MSARAPADIAGEPWADEASMLARLRSGDEQAFALLVTALTPRMLATARRMLASDAQAQDAVQESFLAIFRGLPRFEGNAKLSTWAYAIVRNTCLMRLRSARVRREVGAIEDLLPGFQADGHQVQDSRAWKPLDADRNQSQENSRLVREAIDALPDAHRTVLMLRDVEGLSTEEAAQVLDTTPNAVKIRLHRARQALRTLLEPHFLAPGVGKGKSHA